MLTNSQPSQVTRLLVAFVVLGACHSPPPPRAQSAEEALKQLDSPLDKAPTTRTQITATAQAVSSVEVTPTSISVGVRAAPVDAAPPYRMTPTIRFDGEYLQIKAETDLPDGTLYRLGVQRNIAVKPSPTSTLTSISTHAGGFMPLEKVDLPEADLPTSADSFIPQAGRVKDGQFIAIVQMFPRHVQLLGTSDEPDRYTPNEAEVDVIFAVERDLPGQLEALSWPKGMERFTWRHTVACPLPEQPPRR